MKENKLLKYILISVLIHALILFAFPLANRAGFGEENDTQDFGFIEMVEYKPITQTSQEAGNNQNAEEDLEQEKSVEPDKNIDKNEENEIEIDEETENIEEETEEIVEEDIDNNEQESEEIETEVNEEEIVEETETVSNKDNSEVISSEESDIEMEVEEKPEKQEENQIDEPDENEVNSSEEEQEEEEAPPPPPTSGELIARSITPQYPKDLIGENKKGTVKFLVNIDQTGELINLTMTDSSGIEQIDKTSRLAIERGWEFKSYNMPYSIPIVVDFKINESGNPVIDVNLEEVDFKEVNN